MQTISKANDLEKRLVSFAAAIVAILTENRELCRIIAASIKTAHA
jgi:hypothetical protein